MLYLIALFELDEQTLDFLVAFLEFEFESVGLLLIANTLRFDWFDGAFQNIDIFDPILGDAEWILKVIFQGTRWNALILSHKL